MAIMTDVRVLLVDDHTLSLRAMSAVVEQAAGFEVVGEALSGEQCMLAGSAALSRL